jgi:hypothetical protein
MLNIVIYSGCVLVDRNAILQSKIKLALIKFAFTSYILKKES